MYYIIYSSEVVVYDKGHKKLVSVPAEREAIEYIREHERKAQV